MKPITCILFGKSGAGKGTQARLLREYLEKNDPARKVIYIETGDKLRSFIKGDSFSAKKTREYLDSGRFMPSFIPIWAWAENMIENLTGDDHLILDGLARQLEEGAILDKALQFYDRGTPYAILLDIHRDEAKKRLLARGRHDDKDEKIEVRLKAFEASAMPAIEYFKQSIFTQFKEIDGSQSIEKIHEDILKTLGI